MIVRWAQLMLGSLGLALSTFVTRLQNFAGVMNFVIFPMFFASTALYPLWRLQENAPALAKVVAINPFSHGIELIRFTLYGKLDWTNLIVVVICLALFFTLSLLLLSRDSFRISRLARSPWYSLKKYDNS